MTSRTHSDAITVTTNRTYGPVCQETTALDPENWVTTPGTPQESGPLQPGRGLVMGRQERISDGPWTYCEATTEQHHECATEHSGGMLVKVPYPDATLVLLTFEGVQACEHSCTNLSAPTIDLSQVKFKGSLPYTNDASSVSYTQVVNGTLTIDAGDFEWPEVQLSSTTNAAGEYATLNHHCLSFGDFHNSPWTIDVNPKNFRTCVGVTNEFTASTDRIGAAYCNWSCNGGVVISKSGPNDSVAQIVFPNGTGNAKVTVGAGGLTGSATGVVVEVVNVTADSVSATVGVTNFVDWASNGVVTVTATLNPRITQNLPSCYHYIGGVTVNDVVHTVTRTTPGVTTFIASAGTSSLTNVVVVSRIEPWTVVASPSGANARNTIGVGEQVIVTFEPSEAGPVTWAVTGGGTLTNTTADAAIFIAPDSAATPTVTARCQGIDACSQGFTVLEPSGVVDASVTCATNFPLGMAGAGMNLDVVIGPTNVSFYWVQIMEVGQDASNVTGYFTNHPPLPHGTAQGANRWIPLDNGENRWADVASYWGCGSPWESGSFTWDIPAVWRVGDNGATNYMTGWSQIMSIDGNGTMTVEKFNHAVVRSTNDVSTTY